MKQFEGIVAGTKKYKNKKGIIFKLESLFKGIEIKDKKVLDIGGGDGLISFWMSYKGAEVYCLEPDSDGSAAVDQTDYHYFEEETGLKINLIKKTFQDFNTQEQYDLIIIHNTINHLNELACEKLDHDQESFHTYEEYFHKLYTLLKKNGMLIISDCSRKNFWYKIHKTNPFIKNIEWEKHQAPGIWRIIAENANFKCKKLTWSTFNRFGQIGRVLFGNALTAYFLSSHFNLYLKKN